MRYLARVLSLVLVAIIVGVVAWCRLAPPEPLSEPIFASDPGASGRVAAGLQDVRVVIPDRPHPFPFQPSSRTYLEKITRTRAYHLTTNSRGWRNAEVSPNPAPGTIRVVTVGDSVTLGHGVAQEDAYPSVLRTLLASRGAWEVVNVADIATRLDDIPEHIRSRVLPLHPHVVTLCIGINDVMFAHQPGWSRRAPSLAPDLELIEQFRRKLTVEVTELRNAGILPVLVVPPVNSFFPLPDGALMAEAVRSVARELLVPITDPQRAFDEGERTDGLVLEMTDGEQRVVRYRHGASKVLFSAPSPPERTTYIVPEVYDFLFDYDGNARFCFDSSHPTPEGHARIAADLADLLQTLEIRR